MGQSLVQNYLHIVFSTKHRKPFITSDIENELHNYLAGICNNLGCHTIKIGGYIDHIHILCNLSKNLSLSLLMKDLKASSSKWIKTKGEYYKNFFWQDGYGAFSVKPSDIDKVIKYIDNQHEHHKKKNFMDEYISFLEKSGVEYNDQYLWG